MSLNNARRRMSSLQRRVYCSVSFESSSAERRTSAQVSGPSTITAHSPRPVRSRCGAAGIFVTPSAGRVSEMGPYGFGRDRPVLVRTLHKLINGKWA
jgi:hypothetical protein